MSADQRPPPGDGPDAAGRQERSAAEPVVSSAAQLAAAAALASAEASQAAHRAYIAHAAPHLLDDSPASPSRSRSPSVSGHGSPASPASEGDGEGEGDAGSTSAVAGTSAHRHQSPSAAGTATSRASAAASSSRHKLPPGYRGPPPRPGDAEDIAPQPQLAPTPGSQLMFQAHNTPVNRNAWRYSPCGPASEALPQTVYRSIECEPRGVHWSWTDRSAFAKLSADASTLCTDKGFRGARANVPVRHGAWYVEMHILEPEPLVPGVGAPGPLPGPMSAGPHVRLGWARREAPLNAPAGFDGYSYGLRGATGERVWLSRPSKYGRAFGPGDVVGMYIRLPPPGDEARPGVETAIRRKRLPIRYRGQLYFESLEYAPTKEMESLMDRSKKGLFRWPASAPSSDDALAAGQPSSDGVGPPDAGAKRKKKGPPAEKAEAAAEADKGRPLPTLGAAARIGFCINGEPQGVAFDDLFDFRPLKRLSSAAPSKGKKGGSSSAAAAATAATSLTLVDEDASIITSNSSVASIMKSRENHVDDGALGYFPFATSFGGARVRLVADPAEWRFPPPDDLEVQLEARMPAPSGEALASQAPRWRPYSERYDEYLAEQWELDLADEGRAALKASTMSEAASRLLREEIEEDQRERAMRKKGHNKRKAGGGSATERMRKQAAAGRRDESTPDDGRDTTGSPAPFMASSRAVSSSPPAAGAVHDTYDSGTATPAPMDWDADAAASVEPGEQRMDVDAAD